MFGKFFSITVLIFSITVFFRSWWVGFVSLLFFAFLDSTMDGKLWIDPDD